MAPSCLNCASKRNTALQDTSQQDTLSLEPQRRAQESRKALDPDQIALNSELQNRGVSFQFRDHEIAHSIYFSDPDGFVVEITTYDLPKNESESNVG